MNNKLHVVIVYAVFSFGNIHIKYYIDYVYAHRYVTSAV